MMGMGVGVPNKKKAAMLGIFAARDQWAKFVLLKKRDAYHIWLDEGNMGTGDLKSLDFIFLKKIVSKHSTGEI